MNGYGQNGRVNDVELPRRRTTLLAVALVVLLVDLITKVIATATLEGQEPVRILGGMVYLHLLRNPGAAFSLATDWTWVLAVVAMAVIGAILWFSRKVYSAGWAVGLGLILGGAAGNVVDRVFRAPGPLQGHVVDFVSLFAPGGQVWPVFNAADAAIVTGGALVVLLTLLGREFDGSTVREKAARKAEQTERSGEELS